MGGRLNGPQVAKRQRCLARLYQASRKRPTTPTRWKGGHESEGSARETEHGDDATEVLELQGSQAEQAREGTCQHWGGGHERSMNEAAVTSRREVPSLPSPPLDLVTNIPASATMAGAEPENWDQEPKTHQVSGPPGPSPCGSPGKVFPATSAPGSEAPNRDFACRYPALTQRNDPGTAPSRRKRDLHVSRGRFRRFLVTFSCYGRGISRARPPTRSDTTRHAGRPARGRTASRGSAVQSNQGLPGRNHSVGSGVDGISSATSPTVPQPPFPVQPPPAAGGRFWLRLLTRYICT